MAVNNSRDQRGEFDQGRIDSAYMSIIPDRGGVLASVPTERLSWPNFARVEQDRPHRLPGD